MTDIIGAVSRRLNIPQNQVAATVALLDEGATVPFIARYRKERTGSLDELAVRNIETTLAQVRELEKRKEFVRNAIAEAGALTEQLEKSLAEADSMTAVDDLYAPYKPKRRTRAEAARELGLEPLAKIIMSGKAGRLAAAAGRFAGKKGVESTDAALAGASDIIAEWASESIRLRNIVRRTMHRTAEIAVTGLKDKASELASSPFSDYADFRRPLRRCASHQYLALRRAEREGLVKVKFEVPDTDRLLDTLDDAFIPRNAPDESADFISAAVEDAYKRLLRPSIENEIAAEMKAEADATAIDIFSGNLRQLLMAPPLRGRRVLAIDPGYRTGCKVVALDAQGNLLDDSVIYPTAPKNDTAGARATIDRLIRKHALEVVAIGNGTASRETESFVRATGLIDAARIFVVSESGASVYSASDLARKEFPDKDVTVRGAVSIGRRLIDPLAELVKIDPKAIGVGQYQHDVDQAKLKDALDYTVMSCVNTVGVDLNTASAQLLSYISGIGPTLAANIVKYRAENGDFRTRTELKKVPRLGDKAFELAAGFLRIPGGKNPLDNTAIHPESYPLVKDLARTLGLSESELLNNKALTAEIKGVELTPTMIDIIAELRKPGRDPRLEDASAAFVPEVESFEQLSEGMVLTGLVNNITAFGAFVDLGIHENGLVHISELSNKRVNSVADVLKLGQKVTVRVIGIDRERKRISLSMKNV
ncbi:MAG: RNA-binding transcriptional accessory protein [Bacteroidales bacterium]|nr:RNA-binding transcriptional accessory protein [Bacteroidales bacterium]